MKKMHRPILALAFAVCVVAACTPAQQKQAQSQASDDVILAQIRTKVTAIDAATISEVHIAVRRGVVTLTGETHNDAERRQIEDAARGTNGVKLVDDRIVLNSGAPTTKAIASDVGLETKVVAALAAQTGINAFRLEVHADRGVVTIKGRVQTRALHDTAIETARGVNGVRRVIDKIVIQR
jgi:osmotically-inducible protein OsmY